MTKRPALTVVSPGHYRCVAASPYGFEVWRYVGTRFSRRLQATVAETFWCWKAGNASGAGFGTKGEAVDAAVRRTHEAAGYADWSRRAEKK